MQIHRIHPIIHAVACYEKPLRTQWLCAKDARCLFVLSGGIHIEYGDTTAKLSPGGCLYLPAGTPFRVRSEGVRMIVVRFDLTDEFASPEEELLSAPPETIAAEDLRHPTDCAPFDAPVLFDDLAPCRDTFIKMHKVFSSGGDYAAARAGLLLSDVLLRMAEELDEHALPSRLIEALDEYIRDNADADMSNAELGAIFGYHPFYISQLLKKKRGITLHQYILSYKLRTACHRLRYTNISVADLAASLGFADPSYFTKSFKSVYGMTPKDYRRAVADDCL